MLDRSSVRPQESRQIQTPGEKSAGKSVIRNAKWREGEKSSFKKQFGFFFFFQRVEGKNPPGARSGSDGRTLFPHEIKNKVSCGCVKERQGPWETCWVSSSTVCGRDSGELPPRAALVHLRRKSKRICCPRSSAAVCACVRARRLSLSLFGSRDARANFRVDHSK